MKKRGIMLVLLTAAVVIAVNVIAHTGFINGSNTLLNLVKKFNLEFAARKLPWNSNYNSAKKLDNIISDKSEAFIEAAFKRDDEAILQMLDSSTQYIRSQDGSSFIRYIGGDIHVEGYMATDKKLLKAKQRWHVLGDDNTVTCSMEVYIEGVKSPQLWYLHFKKVKDDWKIYMLENGV